MSLLTTRDLAQLARKSGYTLCAVEQLRPNRWLMALTDTVGANILVLVQARPLVCAADVQDFAQFVQLRRPERGILLAHGGGFSAAAQQTFAELRDSRLRLCTALPPAIKPEAGDTRPLGAPVKQVP